MGYNFIEAEENKLIIKLLNNIEIIHTNKEICNYSIDYRQKRKIKIPDSIILATTKYLGADLVTNNLKDFQNIDEKVKVFELLLNN